MLINDITCLVDSRRYPQRLHVELLQVWDLKDLGMQASQRILDSADPLRLLAELAGNFPSHAGPLSRLEVAADKRTEWAMNRRIMQV